MLLSPTSCPQTCMCMHPCTHTQAHTLTQTYMYVCVYINKNIKASKQTKGLKQNRVVGSGQRWTLLQDFVTVGWSERKSNSKWGWGGGSLQVCPGRESPRKAASKPCRACQLTFGDSEIWRKELKIIWRTVCASDSSPACVELCGSPEALR